MPAPEILVVQAGGTIDKDYLAAENHHGHNFTIGESAAHTIIERAGIPYRVEFISACMKDSLEMDDTDRQLVYDAVAGAEEDLIVVLHGTDTIHETAKLLSSIKGKTIVFTGAMRPERFRDSDADFNVGMAFGAVQHLTPGVYIALYGEVVWWDHYVPR